ncbi:MAG: (Fe-S)-binding protein [Deltaproteobacteria bacterium HGW-Deltaproteobacteria-15]|nr:MAG: (Fe-S)-binding protein [Deltaproteobacteria bacterium HGW-Deltaproteobacteria-15]
MKSDELAHEFNQCIKCGLCMATCPACKELLLEKYSPRGKVQLARYYARGELELSERYRDIFAKCLLCGACGATCPSGVDLKKIFLGMREEIAGKKGAHPLTLGAVQSLARNRNISGEDNEERWDWKESLKGVPEEVFHKKKAEVVYFVGCVSSFFPMVQSIPQNFVRILSETKSDFAVLGGEEWCCGFPLIGAGLTREVEELKAHNLEKIRALGAGKVVFSCPSCFRMWKEYYGTDVEMLHATQFIHEMVRNKTIRFRRTDMTVTYHDPCDLGRNTGVFDAPREILKAVPGLTLVELENNRMKSVCCGGGGNVEMVAPDLSGAVAQKKIEEIRRTGAKTVLTSCQQCVRTIKGRARRQKVDLQVMDINEFVYQMMERKK